jgi:hypothetical protein
MMATMEKDWMKLAKEAGIDPNSIGSQTIVDDVLLAATNIAVLLDFLKVVLQVLQHYRVTIKLKKCKWLEPSLQFVAIDVSPDGNSPASSKFEAFQAIPRPSTWTDLRMLIGMFGFYQHWIERYEVRIKPFRKIQAKSPRPGLLSLAEESSFFSGFWLPEHDKLLEELKADILSKPTLARPDPHRRFYLKTDWSCEAMGAVLCQAPDDENSKMLESKENEGEACAFEKHRNPKKSPRLLPIKFLSRSTTLAEKSFHSYVGEASVGRWAMQKLRKYLIGSWFTWITDCSGLTRFLNSIDNPTHMIQRWRAELLQFMFTLVHRPAEMMTECNMLSRYNVATELWRSDTTATHATIHATMVDSAMQLFSNNSLQENRTPMCAYPLPNITLVGENLWAFPSTLSQVASKDRCFQQKWFSKLKAPIESYPR